MHAKLGSRRNRTLCPMMRMENRNPNSPMMRMKRHEYEDELPEEVIREILLRLSVRVLLRLRSVCRSWNSLISSHEFAMIHLQRSTLTQRPPLLCWKGYGRTNDIMHCSSQSLILYRQQPTFVSHPVPRKLIRGSCNGLLCLSQGFPYKTLTLFNPSTRSVSPSVPFGCSDECGNFVFGGFGYDILHDQYKFVMGCRASFLLTDSKVRSGAIVFTFGANPCWKTVDHPVFPYRHLKRDGIFVSGTLNWLVYDPTSTLGYEIGWFVLTFDLETESFGRMRLPIVEKCSHYMPEVPELQLHNNCLSYSSRAEGTMFCTFWIMKEYGVEDSWIKLFEIPFAGMSPYVSPLHVSEDHNLLALDKSDGSLFVYNLRQNDPVYFHGYYYRVSFFLCHESLVSPLHYRGLKTIH